MVEVSNSDLQRIFDCMDIAQAHYSSLPGLRNNTRAWCISQMREKLIRKLNKQPNTPKQ